MKKGESMSIFDDIKTGLNQAIDFEKGKGKARVTVMTIHPVDQFSPDEIKQIRTDTGMTQVLFAQYMGVSVKTVEAWEAGRNHPVGAACRLLAMTKNDPDFPVKSGVVVARASN